MPKIALAILVISSTFATEDASHPKDEAAVPKNLGQWTEKFQTKVGEVVHAPDRVSMGFMSAGTCLNMDAKLFNGVPLKSPLILEVNSTREQFIAAMKKSGIIE